MYRRALGTLALVMTFGVVGLQPVGATTVGATGGPRTQPTVTCDQTWHTVPTPKKKKDNLWLYGVAAVSATDAWAVGLDRDKHNVEKPLIERWDGAKWSVVKAPLPKGALSGVLRAVAVASPTDVWAVGQYVTATGDYLALAERWNGATWSLVSTGLLGTDVNASGVDVISSNDVWMVGDQGIHHTGFWTTFTGHWNGTSWSAVPSPNKNGSVDDLLHAVSGTSSSDVWAVGGASDQASFHGLVEHWNGSSWSIVKSPTTAFFLQGAAAVSTTDAWTVSTDTSGSVLEIDRWNGSKWHTVPSVPGSEASGDGMAAASGTDVWAIGTSFPESGQRVPLAEHWNGSTWTRVAADFPTAVELEMHGISVTADGSTAFAVGSYAVTPTSNSKTLAQIWC